MVKVYFKRLYICYEAKLSLSIAATPAPFVEYAVVDYDILIAMFANTVYPDVSITMAITIAQ